LIQYLINVKLLCVAYSPRPDEVMIVRYVHSIGFCIFPIPEVPVTQG